MTLRVLQVIKSLGLGGAERLLLDGAVVAPSLGMQHEVVSFLPWKDALVGDLRAAGVPVHLIPRTTSLTIAASTTELARLIRIRRIDIVHAHLPVACAVARLACRLAGVPCVTTEHNVLERYHPVTRALALSTWPLQQAVVACSAEVGHSIARHLPASSTNPPVIVVQNGIAAKRFRVESGVATRVRAELGFAEDAFVVGTVAVHRAQKSLDRWLRVAARIIARVPRSRFVLVGDGPLRPALQEQARAQGLASVVAFPGLQRDPAPWLAAMNLWLSTSTFEGLPLALLEAMAARRPVVATAVGGVSEVLTDGVHGRLCRADDEDGLVAAVVDLAGDEEQRARLAGAAADHVEARFGIEAMQRSLLDVYRACSR
jgi:glycosyltransferase involved in cell wall biosynthesis